MALPVALPLRLVAPNGAAGTRGAQRVAPTTSARDALSMLLLAGGRPLLVVEGEDRVKGLVTIELLEQLVSSESATGNLP